MIHNLKAGKGTAKKRKRIGRGNASGTGTYSGKGQKGQKSRSGVSNLKRLGMKQMLLRTPKLRGVKSHKPKNQIVNLAALNKFFKDKEIVSPQTLLEKGLIKDQNLPVKVLGQGELKLSGLKISGLKLSDSAKEKADKQKSQIS